RKSSVFSLRIPPCY
ncbi:hypothetical protein CP10139811_1239B, partial [Chlamydia ibidis]